MEGLRIQRLAYICAIFYLLFEGNINVVGAEEELHNILPPAYNEALRSGLITLENIWYSHTFRFAKDKDNVVTMVYSANYKQGWLGMGLSTRGGMVGSSAMVAWLGEDGKSNIHQYSLGGKVPSKVVLDNGTLALTKLAPVSIITKGTLHMAFQLKLPSDRKKHMVILAASRTTPDNHSHLVEHLDRTTMEIDFDQGTVETFAFQKTGHGLLGLLAWQVAIPLGILFPVYFKHLDPQWFYLHVAFQTVGYFFALINVLLGLKLATAMHAEVTWHKYFGLTVIVLATLQIFSLVWRPGKNSSMRKLWNIYHVGLGYIAAALGFLNVYLGIRLANAGFGWMIVFFSLLTFYGTLFLTLGGREEDIEVQPPVFNLIMRV